MTETHQTKHEHFDGSTAARISKNALFVFAARIIDTLGQVGPLCIVPRYLGAEYYGDYGFAIAFALIPVSFTYIGIERIIVREIARDKGRAGFYLGGAILTRWFYMAMLIPFLTIVILFMKLPANIVIGICLAILAFNFMGDALINLAMFKAFEKMGYDTLLTFAFQFINLCLLLIVSFYNLGFLYLFYGLITAQAARCCISYIISYKYFSPPRFGQGISMGKFLFRETYIFGIFVLLNQLFVNTDLLILKYFKDTFQVSIFYAPHILVILMTVLPNALLSSVFPLLSQVARDDRESLRDAYERCFRITVFFVFFLLVPCISFAHKIIPLVFGKDFVAAIYPLQVLSIGMIFLMLSFVQDYILAAVNQQNSLIFCAIGGLLVKIALDFLLIPPYGFMGAVISAVVGNIAFFSIGFFLASKYIGFLKIHRLCFKPALVIGLLILGLSYIKYDNLYVMTIVCFLLYSISLVKLKYFSHEETQLLRNIYHKLPWKK